MAVYDTKVTGKRTKIKTSGKPSKYCRPGYVSTRPSMNSVTTSATTITYKYISLLPKKFRKKEETKHEPQRPVFYPLRLLEY